MIEQERVDKTAEDALDKSRGRTLPVNKAAPRKTKIMWLAAAVLAFIYFSGKGVSNNKILLLAGLGLAMYYFSFQGKENPDFYLGEKEAKALLYDALRYKQTNSYSGEYEIAPEDTIIILMPARLRKFDGTPVKWEIGYKIRKASGLMNTYSGEIDAKTGTLMGLVERPSGFTGNEVPDVKFIKGPKLVHDLRYLKAGGDLLRRGRSV